MDFAPIVHRPPRLMDERIFLANRWACAIACSAMPLEERFSYDAEQNVFFINFERLAVKSLDDIEKIRTIIEAHLAPLKKKVFGIVNYENFTIRRSSRTRMGRWCNSWSTASTTA